MKNFTTGLGGFLLLKGKDTTYKRAKWRKERSRESRGKWRDYRLERRLSRR